MDAVSGLLQHLPSCERCRKRRVRCHQSPSGCSNCLSLRSECEIYDHHLERLVATKTLFALSQRLERLNDALSGTELPRPDAAGTVDEDDNAQLTGTNSQSHDGYSWEPPQPSCRPALTSFGYLYAISDLVQQKDETIKHLERTPTTTTASSQPGVGIAIDTSRWAPPQGLPFSRATAQYLLDIYCENVELILPVFGHSMRSHEAINILDDLTLNRPRLVETSGSHLCVQLSMAIALVLCASSPTLNLCEDARTQLQAHSFLHWAGEILDTTMIYVKKFIEINHVPDADEEVSETALRTALETVRLLLLLVIYGLFMPQKANSRQILGFADRILVGHYEAVRGSAIEVHPEFLPPGTSLELSLEVNRVFGTFVVLERLVAMSEGLPFSKHSFGEQELYAVSDSQHGRNCGITTRQTTPAALFGRLVDIKGTVHKECLSLMQLSSRDSQLQSNADGQSEVSRLLSSTEAQVKAWRDQWTRTARLVSAQSNNNSRSDASTGRSPYLEWLLLYGQTLGDEALLFAFRSCFSVAHAMSSPHTGRPNSSTDQMSFSMPTRATPTLRPSGLDGMTGFATKCVNSLSKSYADLLLTARYRHDPTETGPQIPLLYHCTWLWSLQVFDLAITETWLGKFANTSTAGVPFSASVTSDDPTSTRASSEIARGTSSNTPTDAPWISTVDLCVRLLLACGQANPSSARTLNEAIFALQRSGPGASSLSE
ncbi:hypothetical protein H2204_000177 [Knufia peltigerae]|uniref:Zn(2)-C6 fungal-type domain-containing protein n=1 Tax=Knufia peltigerae TaxID=1002370 RepID=A0AA38YFX2_9EURO|nr:hypothetical protein H2204_000177 [Knufia peltigerae]